MTITARLRALAAAGYGILHLVLLTIGLVPYSVSCALASLGNGPFFRRQLSRDIIWQGDLLFSVLRGILALEVHWHLPQAGLPLPSGSAIIVANHTSAIDAPLMCAALKRIGRRSVRWSVKKELRWMPPLGLIARLLRCAFVSRRGRDRSWIDLGAILHAADNAREEGADFLIFPEGKRFTGAEPNSALRHLRPPKPGGFHTALARLPLAPIISITFVWSGRQTRQAHGRTIWDGADIVRQRLDIHIEVIPRKLVDDDPRWLYSHWRTKDELLNQKP